MENVYNPIKNDLAHKEIGKKLADPSGIPLDICHTLENSMSFSAFMPENPQFFAHSPWGFLYF